MDALETYKSLIKLSTEGFRFSALINGGAAVALLAYYGQVVPKGAPAPDLSTPMGWFLGGLALCGFSMFCAYLTQLRLLEEQIREGLKDRHKWILRAAIVLFFASLIAFIAGALLAVSRFQPA